MPDRRVPDITAYAVFAWKDSRNHEKPKSGPTFVNETRRIRNQYIDKWTTASGETAICVSKSGIMNTFGRRKGIEFMNI